MNLMPIEELATDLVCPRCRSPLSESAASYRCSSAPCGQAYSVIARQPVLVDFENSILVAEQIAERDAQSAISRGADVGMKRRIIKALSPINRVAEANATRLIELGHALSPSPKLLIIGGGSKGEGTEKLYSDSGLRLIAFDIYSSDHTQFVADAHRIPLADESVHAVWIQAVLEHVLDPAIIADEIHRVLKRDGLVYAETPFMQQVHEGAYDFTRFTESGHRWLFRRFEEIDSGIVLGPASQLIWSIEHVVRGIFRSVKAGIVAKLMLFWLRYLDRLIPRRFASDAASAVYFMGRKSELAMRPKQMVAYYKGAHARIS